MNLNLFDDNKKQMLIILNNAKMKLRSHCINIGIIAAADTNDFELNIISIV